MSEIQGFNPEAKPKTPEVKPKTSEPKIEVFEPNPQMNLIRQELNDLFDRMDNEQNPLGIVYNEAVKANRDRIINSVMNVIRKKEGASFQDAELRVKEMAKEIAQQSTN